MNAAYHSGARRGFDRRGRSGAAELMDSQSASYEDYRACLQDLSAVNGLTLGRRPVLRFLSRVLPLPEGLRAHVLDVGFGHGDTLRAVRERARARGWAVDLSGVDLNPWAARAAAEATPWDVDISYHVGDVFAFQPERPVDFVVSSLFTHHLDDDSLVRFIGYMEATARRGWFVNDLHRHALSYHGFRLLASVMRWHRFVRHDGPVSIARSFRPRDWERLLAQAGVPSGAARIFRQAPFRLCVERVR